MKALEQVNMDGNGGENPGSEPDSVGVERTLLAKRPGPGPKTSVRAVRAAPSLSNERATTQ